MIHHITSLSEAPDLFLTDNDRNLSHRYPDIFIGESPKVIIRCLEAGYQPEALLMQAENMSGNNKELLASLPPEVPVYIASAEILSAIRGYSLSRGVAAAFRRRPLPSAEELCRDARFVAVIDGVCDTTNIGLIFRNAAALGVEAVLLTSNSCDPLNRRSLRTSMGTVMQVPWTQTNDSCEALKPILSSNNLKMVALALTDDSVTPDHSPLLSETRIALVLGAEGPGLPKQTIEAADYVMRIPMAHGVDSLNVAASSAIAFWQFRHFAQS